MNHRQTTTWCAGLPRSGVRPFTEDERAAIRALSARLLWQVALGILLTPLMVVALLAAISLQGSASRLAGITGLLTALSPAAATVIVRDAWRRRAALKTDLDRSEMWILIRPEDQPPGPFHSMEMLPASQTAWLVDGQRPKKWLPAETSEVANTPEYAATAAEWVEPSNPSDEASPRFNHREISAAERDEIERHLHRLRWSSAPVAILVTLWAAFRLTLAVLYQTVPSPFFLIWLAGTSMVDLNLYKRWRLAGRLTLDLRAGRIVIARRPVNEEGQEGLSAPIEVLPQSRLVWTQSGQPAAWRVAHTVQTSPRR